MRGNCPDPYTPPASKGSRSGGVSSRQRRHESFEKGVRKPSWDQGQAGTAFVWQETSGVTSSPPGLGPASSCTPHPPRQDRGLGAAAAPGLPAFVSGAFRRGRLARGVPCPLEGAGRGHGRGTLGEREREACCLPRKGADTGALVLGQRGSCWPDGERPGAGAGEGERRASRPSHQPLPPSPQPASGPARDPGKGSPHSHPDKEPPKAVLGLRPQRCRNPPGLGHRRWAGFSLEAVLLLCACARALRGV